MSKMNAVKSAKICLVFETETVNGSRDFKSVHELASYPKNEPEIAKLVGYIHNVKLVPTNYYC